MAFNINGSQNQMQTIKHVTAAPQKVATPISFGSGGLTMDKETETHPLETYDPISGTQIRFKTVEDHGEWLDGWDCPIDPMWGEASMWAGLSDTPVIVRLNVPKFKDPIRHYVITKTRAFTHSAFVSCVAAMKWQIYATPTMRRGLFRDAGDNHMLGKLYSGLEVADHDTDRIYDFWWDRTQSEFKYNCLDWVNKNFPDEEDFPKLLEFLDLDNIKFEETKTKLRTDSHQSGWGAVSVDGKQVKLSSFIHNRNRV